MTGDRRDEERGRGPHSEKSEPTSTWEWIVAGIGLVLVLGVIGYVGYAAFQDKGKVPVVTVEALGVEPVPNGYAVQIQVRNRARVTAAKLEIEGELRQGDRAVETSSITFDYLPSLSERKGGIFFERDPQQHELRLVVKGYVEP